MNHLLYLPAQAKFLYWYFRYYVHNLFVCLVFNVLKYIHGRQKHLFLISLWSSADRVFLSYVYAARGGFSLDKLCTLFLKQDLRASLAVKCSIQHWKSQSVQFTATIVTCVEFCQGLYTLMVQCTPWLKKHEVWSAFLHV